MSNRGAVLHAKFQTYMIDVHGMRTPIREMTIHWQTAHRFQGNILTVVVMNVIAV
jgi:hypothetical protein